jgi:membrane-associated phospholipid phosphatase
VHVFTYNYLSWRFFTLVDAVGPLGELWVAVPIAVVLVLWCLVSGERRGALAIAVATSGTLGLVALVKLIAFLVGPPWRPHWDYVSNLFPSGHEAMGTVVYGAAAICAARAAPRFARAFGLAAAALVLLLGLQRIASGSHPFGDVIGGVLFGLAGLAVLVQFWPYGKLRPVGLPVAAAAMVLIAVAFYSRSVPSAQIVGRVATDIEHTIGTLKSFAVGKR